MCYTAVKFFSAMALTDQKCVPCEGGVDPLPQKEAAAYHTETPLWSLGLTAIERDFTFKNFKQAMRFVNAVAEIAEQEGHHPDISIFYSRVKLWLTTHAIKGLSVNDFILAAKIDKIYT